MTATVDDFLAPKPKRTPEKDRYGRYLIPGPDGGDPKAHTRMTTFIKTLDGGGDGLKLWYARYAVKGVTSDKARLGRVSTWDADPANAETKKEFNRLLDEATTAAGINSKRDQGSALHDATELVDADADYEAPEHMVRPLANYVELVGRYGLRWLASEQIVVLDELGIAGRFDRITEPIPGWFTKPRILDIKTGSIDYPGSFALQLAGYSQASAIYDPATGERSPFPDVDKEKALVLHLPIDGSPATLYEVDIGVVLADGVLDIIALARDWNRKARKVLSPAPEPAGEVIETTGSEVEPVAVEGASPEPSADLRAVEILETAFPGIQLEPQSWVLGRLAELKAAEHGLDALRSRWPAGVGLPGPVQRGEESWTDGELALIIPAVCDAASSVQLPDDPTWPFGPPSPLSRPAAEDEPADPDDAKRVRALLSALDDDRKAVVKSWIEQGASNRTPWGFGRQPSCRRLNLGRSACRLVSELYDPAHADDAAGLIHEAIDHVTGTPDPTVAIGVRLGRLSPSEATALAEFTAGPLEVLFTDGHPHIKEQP